MENTTYTPIDCAFYDVLELAAMRRQYIDLRYRDMAAEGEEKVARVFVETLWAKNGEEFMKLTNGTIIRLDHIISVDSDYNEAESWHAACSCK